MYSLYVLALSLPITNPPEVPPIQELPAQVPEVKVAILDRVRETPPIKNSYLEAAQRAVDENKKLYVFIGRDAIHIPNAISGRYQGEFPGVKGPALVIAEPDGKGWLKITEVRRDFQSPLTTFRVEERTFGSPSTQPIFHQQPIQRFSGPSRMGRGGGSC